MIIEKIDICIDKILSTIFRFDLQSYPELLILKDEVNELFEYRFILEDIKGNLENYEIDYISKYIDIANHKNLLIHGQCISRLKKVKNNPLLYFSDGIPENILNMSIYLTIK